MTKKPDIQSFKECKFGLFIHYGLYSIQGEGEWAMYFTKTGYDEYKKLAEQPLGEKFNAEEIIKLAKSFGCRYAVLTSRHHDGYCLFDSKHSIDNFTSTKTAAKRDFVKEYMDACHKENMFAGLYYSPLDFRNPASFVPGIFQKEAKEMVEQCHKQVEELMTNYGKVDLLWYDGGEDYIPGMNVPDHKHSAEDILEYKKNPPFAGFWNAEELNNKVREWQPGIVINNRFGNKQIGDYVTPEKQIGEYNVEKAWETCECVATSWGWVANDTMKTYRKILQTLVMVVTGGGNLLLNVAPKADGTFEQEQIERMQKVGRWLEKYGESIYGTQGGPVVNGPWGGMTHKENNAYIHVIEWVKDKYTIPVPEDKLTKVSALNAEINFEIKDNKLTFSVSEEDMEKSNVVIKLEFTEDVEKAYAPFSQEELTVNLGCDNNDKAINLGQ